WARPSNSAATRSCARCGPSTTAPPRPSCTSRHSRPTSPAVPRWTRKNSRKPYARAHPDPASPALPLQPVTRTGNASADRALPVARTDQSGQVADGGKERVKVVDDDVGGLARLQIGRAHVELQSRENLVCRLL